MPQWFHACDGELELNFLRCDAIEPLQESLQPEVTVEKPSHIIAGKVFGRLRGSTSQPRPRKGGEPPRPVDRPARQELILEGVGIGVNLPPTVDPLPLDDSRLTGGLDAGKHLEEGHPAPIVESSHIERVRTYGIRLLVAARLGEALQHDNAGLGALGQPVGSRQPRDP